MNRTNLIVSLATILVLAAVAIGSFAAGARPQLGLDLQGGISAALQPDPDAANQPDDIPAALEIAVNLIRERVDSLGVAEPDIALQGDDTILVQLPGVTDAEQARQVIGQTAQLGFYPVLRPVVPGTPEYVATPPCVIPQLDADGEMVLGPDDAPVYILNPDRPSPSRPAEDGTRYVCDEFRDEPETDPEPVDTGADVPPLQDLLSESEGDATDGPTDGATDGGTDEPTPDAPTDPATAPSDDASTEAMAPGAGEVRAAEATEPSEAPTPTETATSTDGPTDGATETDAPTEAPTEFEPPAPIDDGLPPDAPRPLKYVVGDAPTDVAPDAPTEDPTGTPTEDATGGATEDDTAAPTVDDTAAPTVDDTAAPTVDDTEPAAPAAGDPLSGDDVVRASATIGASGWVVQLDLDADGAEAFRLATADLACQRDIGQLGQLAIVLDDVVRSAPSMAQGVLCGQGIAGGSATITVGDGMDPEAAQDEAQALALVLNVGALPLTLTEATFNTVSPSLGSASLRNGLIAGVIGLLLVAAYLLFFYRLGLGLVAIGGLTMFLAMTLGMILLLGQIGLALTLAGVVGIILSIGIATDTTIIYFERLRDEVSAGKTVRTAARRAFRAAWKTNLTGNTVAFAAALILYFLAIGPVRGFALTLGISTILDLFIVWAFTRPVTVLLADGKRLTRQSVMPRRSSGPVTTPGGAA